MGKVKESFEDSMLYELYIHGFDDGLDEIDKSELYVKAYKLGQRNSQLGDMVRELDYLTKEEIIKTIKDER